MNQVFFCHIGLLLIFLSMFPNIKGTERVVATFVMIFLLSYAISEDLQASVIVSVVGTILLSFLTKNRTEYFDVEPAGDDAEGEVKITGKEETKDSDETEFDEDDLDKILSQDKKDNSKEQDPLKDVEGLEHLQKLLNMAKKDSPYSKDKNDYTPAQAQRETFRLIDTLKQLKETMTDMMPMVKAGTSLIEVYKKMGGDKFN